MKRSLRWSKSIKLIGECVNLLSSLVYSVDQLHGGICELSIRISVDDGGGGSSGDGTHHRNNRYRASQHGRARWFTDHVPEG
mmetsp:Transcript_18803/g.34942  ORF Transcript_18803/g.34942 Transcript_18803/m.34942 type:complete len:82 (-) Transcript_18803:243-488(-)